MRARNVLLGLLLGAIVLFPACSSNSPTAPPPSPTPVAYSISLTASPAEALVNGGILLSARVTSGGKDVPDNTSVTFTISSCVPNQNTSPGFGENMLVMTCETTRTTKAGVATATIWSAVEGTFEVVARVPGVSAKIPVKWTQPINPGTLAIYHVTPNRGRPEGGQQVVIYGRGFAKPLAVDFLVGIEAAHAQVLGVNAAGTEITVVTPPVPGTVTTEVVADVRVTAAFGTADQVSDTLQGGYTYERTFGEPRIYSVEPARGSYTGGEQVTIYGANFFANVRVRFDQEEAQVASVSADNARVTVFTPRHPGAHLTQDLVVDVTVVTRAETVQEQETTLADAYTYVPDSGVPLLYSVVPSRGSPRGGETVVITGKNFTQPVNVEFIIGAPVGVTLPAVVQSVNAGGTQIILTTPQASPQPLSDDALTDIRITNLVGSASSESATFAGVFTYTKEARELDIYQVVPNRGKATGGERVVIAGRGFVQPVRVDFIAGGVARPAEVVSVNGTGTSIVVTTPSVPLDAANELVADVRVTAAAGTTIEQQATLTAAFTYERQFGEPRIYGVVPNRGSYDGGDAVSILGADFYEPLQVKFGNETAEVLSATASEIVVRTPRHNGQFITEELLVPVSVTTRFDTTLAQTVTREEAYTYLPNTGTPLLYGVVPSRGTPRGGDTVTLTGKNFHPPVTVEFIIGDPVNATLPATVVSTSADATQITLLTPQASPDPLATDAKTSIRITNLVGTAISQTATFNEVFTYEREAKDIAIYSVAPNRGSAEGGEQVTIHGKGFVNPVQVDFIVGGAPLSAQVVSVTDGEIVCMTPAVPGQTVEEVTADVKVTAAFGLPTQKEATLTGGFTFEKPYPAPQIYLIAPSGIVENSPPYPVTIYGANFFEPVRVKLGDEDATVQSVSDDGATIQILTPMHSGGPGTVNVTVFTRFETAQQQQAVRVGGFTWLPAIVETGTPVIYSVNPNRGSRVGSEPVTIIGANLCTLQATATGFECVTPPTVNFIIGAPLSLNRAAQVVSYTPDGRQISILTPQASPQPLAQDTYATVRVTNNTGSGELVDGFVYLRDETPVAIYSVTPSRGRPEGGQTVTIIGRGFVGPIINVEFITAAGGSRAAEVVSFNAAGSEIVVKTPATGVDASVEHVADIKVTVAVGTANQKDVTLEGAFTYEKRYAAPLIYSVVPNKGSWAGGDTLQIIGANFVAPVRVTLGGENAEVLASSTESVLQVKTPLHPNTHLLQELVVDVTVFTSFETSQQQQAALAGGFTWIPDTGVPLLYSVVPNKGDPRGGETVTLTGSNFTEPVTVEFLLGAPYGTTLPATVLDVNDDGTQITIRTPQASPTPVTSEIVVAIRITNLVGSAFSQTGTFQGVFTYESESDLAIYSVTPNRGKAEGGDTVQILGRGFIAPVTVDFIVSGQARHAEVLNRTDTELVVQTPATGLDSAIERIADVLVTAAAGTANQISDTLPQSFTYEKFFGAPAIYAVIPDRGSWAGNEVVTIVGANFFTPLRVFFGAEEATVDTGASTATTLVVRTPQHLQGHLTEDLVVDVTVRTRFDTAQQQEVILAGGFTWKPDTGIPLLYSVTPNRGDPRGGEEVTLLGKNFTQPVSVEFILGAPISAIYPATVTFVDAAGGTMKILTPQASPSPLTQEVEVDIRITNLVGSPSSETATFLKSFTYNTESDLAIYTVSPNRGSPTGGQTVEIRGRGFIPTVRVHFLVGGAEREAQVVAVTDGGARIEIRTPASNVDATVEHIADVRVTVAADTVNQKSTTLPSSYTYEKQFAAPAIYSVQPNRGSHAGGETVEIFGSGFFTPVRVMLGDEIATVDVANSTETKLVITTPVHSPSHLTSDLTVDVTVFTRFETAQQQQVVLAGGFTWVPDTGVPILYSVIPSRGSPRGNEDVDLIGRNFTAPVTVDFILGAPLNTTLPATVVDVTTNPDGTQTIRIKTPQASPTPVTTDVVCAIRITNLVGSTNSQTATFPGTFTYEGESRTPVVYFVLPDKGSPRGGETVTVYGRFFLPPVRVEFSFTANGVAKTVDAEIVELSSDGTQITVITPTASLEPLDDDAPADIRVTSQYSTGRDQFATLQEGFLYLAEHPTPELFALTPNSGPIEGGTRVTITGTGFQYPVQVFFTIPVYGAIQAQVVSVNFNQVVVVTPSLTPMAPDTPTIAQVKAINMETGKISNELTFRYGNAMFISAIAPVEGPDLGGTMVTIFGQGFVAPLTVELAGVPAQILTVAGTEIVVRANAPTERECAPITGPVEVTNIDSNLSATGPNYTYLPARPLITSVEVFSVQVPPGNNIVQEYDPTRAAPCNTNDPYGLYTVIVRGENFEQYPNSSASAMSVIFENPDIEVLTTWVSETEVHFTLPDLSAVILDKAECVINGAPGLRDIPTGLGFTIKNNNNGCTDELDPAIILNPCDPNCKAGVIQVTLSPSTLNLGVGTTGNMTACISAVQAAPVNITIQRSGSAGIIDFTDVDEVHLDPITLVLAPGDVCEVFQITALSGGSVGVVASLDVSLGGSTDTAQVTVGALGITLSPTALTLPVGGTGNLTIQLSAPAPVGGAPVLIAQAGPVGKIDFGPMLITQTCFNPYPITQVTCDTLGNVTSFWALIPAGTSTFPFPVNGLNAGGPVSVSATLDPSLGGAIAVSTVVVGQYNVSLSPSTLTIPVGGSGTFTVSLDAPAFDFDPSASICGIQVQISQTGPGGVIDFTYDADGAAGVPSGGCGPGGNATGPTGAVTISDGTQIASFTVNGISGGGPVTVTVSLPAGVGGATASSTVNVSTYIVTLTPDSLLIPLGTTGNFMVTLNAPAPVGGAQIYLTQVGQVGIVELLDALDAPLANDALGDYVTVPAAGINVPFHVRGLQEGGPIQVTATLDPGLGTSSDTSTVTVGTLTLSASPVSLTVPVHGSNTFILSLSKAQATNTVVSLASSNPAVAIPWNGVSNPAVADTSVTILAGSLTSPPVYVYGVNLGPATLYASLLPALGGATAQVALNVTQAIQFIPSALTVPVGSEGTFTLQVASAQSVPTPIELDYSGTGGAVAGPATVTLVAFSNTHTFNVWGMKPTSTPVSIVATLPNTLPAGLAGATATGTVTVSGAPYTLTFNPSVINLPVGASTNVTASFNYPLPPVAYMGGGFYPYTINLSMSAPAGVIQINNTGSPANDTITWTSSAGQQVADAPFIVNALANGGPVTISGVATSAIGGPVGTAVATVGPATTTLTMSPSPFMWTHFGGPPAPGGPIGLFISPIQFADTIVQLQSSNPAVVQVPTTATILANTASITFIPTIVSTGTATITATIPPPPAPEGVSAQAAALATTDEVTVFMPTIAPAALSIPAGGSGTITFTLSNPLPVSLPGVTLTGFNPAVISVPSPVTIPAGVTTYDVTVTAVAPGGPTSITATMPPSVGGAVLAVAPAVTVDSLTFTLSVGTSTLYVGSSTTATVETALPVPSDTTVTLLDYGGTGDLTIPATATILSGTTTATFDVTGALLGARTLSAALPASFNATNQTVAMTVADLPLTLTTAPDATLYQGSSLTATLTIPAVLDADAVVTVSQTGVGALVIPPTATILAGTSSIDFQVLPGVTNGAVSLRGTLPAALNAAVAPHAAVALTVADQTLVLAPNPLNMAPNSASSMTATIDRAPLADAVVTLLNNDPGIFTIPASITIPAGNTSTSFNVNSLAVSDTGTFDATLPAALDLTPAAVVGTVNVTSLGVALTPPNIGSLMAAGGQLYTVSIDAPVAQDVAVQLVSSQPLNVSVPASVIIPAGSTSATFVAVGEAVTGVSTDIDATLPPQFGGGTDTATITTVIPLTIAATPSAVNLPSLTEQTIVVTTGTILAKNVNVAIASLDPISVALFDLGGAPTGTLALTTGTNSGAFKIRGLAVTFPGPNTIVALNTSPALGGGVPPEATVSVGVQPLQLQFAVTTLTVGHGATAPVIVRLRDGSGNPVVVAVPTTVNIVSANPSIASVVTPQVVIPAGLSQQFVAIFGNSPGGPVTITAQLDPSVGGATAVLEVGVSVAGAPGPPIPPTITTISPNSGPDTGGTNVTINGSLFWAGATVTFDGIPATNVQQVGPSQITCTTPPHAAGAVDVVITNPNATSVTEVGGFTYVVPGTATIVLSPDPLVWYSGAAGELLTVGISPVLAGDTDITLTSSNAIVANPPATVTITGGNATATFDPGFGSDGTALITATLPAGLGGGTATASVTQFGLTFTPNTTIAVGVGAIVNVAMSTTTSMPVPMNVTVAQTSVGTDVVSVPSPVTIPAGSMVDIPVTGVSVGVGNAIVAVTLPASAGGSIITPAITADVSAPTWTRTPTAASVPVGGTTDVTVTLNAALPSDATFLLSAAVGNFTFPPTVTVPAGQLSASFSVTGVQLGGPNDLTITSPAGFSPMDLDVAITVTSVTLQISPNAIGPLMAGGGHTFTLIVSQAQAAPFDITVWTAAGDAVSVPASVQMPAGATQVTFPAIAEYEAVGATTINADLPAALNNVAGPDATATVSSISALTIAASPTNLNMPAATEEVITVTTGVTLAKNVTIMLSTDNPEIVGLFTDTEPPVATGSVTIPAGSNSATFRIRGVGVGSALAVYLDTPSDLGGVDPNPEAEVTVTVLGLQLQFNEATYTVEHGATSPLVDLEAILTDGGGGTISVVMPVTVRITSADPTSVLLLGPGGSPVGASPIDIVIDTGDDRENFSVFGNSPGGPFAVTGALLPPLGNDTAVLQVGVSNPVTAWTFSLDTNVGCATGGNSVTITSGGAGGSAAFWNNVQVTFGGAPATIVSQTPAALVVTVPPHAAGYVDVSVTNPTVPEVVTNTGDYLYLGTFTVSSVVSDIFGALDPDAGPTSGGTTFYFTGTGFVNGYTYNVAIGGNTYTATATSSALLELDTPDLGYPTAGPVDVTIDDGVGCASVTLPGGITYYDAPVLANVSPTLGPAAGGNTVTITGFGFLPGGIYAVAFDSTPATNVVVVDPLTITCTAPANGINDTVDVTVVDGVLQSDTLADVYDYYLPPTITSLSVTSGPPAGGTVTNVNGTFFPLAVYSVDFGGAAVNCTANGGGTALACTTPAHAPGAVNVTATDAAGQSDVLNNGFTYAGAPIVTSVVPPQGPAAGGQAVTINGTFTAGNTHTVSFDPTGVPAACTGVVVTATQIQCTTTAHTAGPFAVRVTDTTTTQQFTLAGAYTYYAAPTVTSVNPPSPAAGGTGGGTSVTINGTNYLVGGTYTVLFGGVAATGVSVTSTTTIDATTPAHAAGAVTVQVTDAAGQSDPEASAFTYYAPPTLASVSLNTAPYAANPTITFTGTNYLSTGTYTALFGAEAGTNYTYVNSTTIQFDAPNGPVTGGIVNVSVADPAGQSASLLNAFTFYRTPTVASIAPTSGSLAGGTAVTVTGSRFVPGAGPYTVTIDPTGTPAPCTGVTVVNSNTITCTTGAHAIGGPFTVRVTDPLAQSGTSGGGIYTYNADLTLQVIATAATGGTISDGTNSCAVGPGGGTNTCGPFTVTTSPLAMTKAGAGTGWSWGGACSCAVDTSPCALNVTASPLTCTLTITAP